MKTIKILVTVLFTTIFLQAFAVGGKKLYHGSVNASGTHFTKGTSSDRWNNTNSQTATKANYANFDGETFVSLIAYDKQTEILLESKVKVTKGRLCVIVENAAGEIVFEKTFQRDETIYATLTLDVYEQYKIRFVGEQTKGSYHAQWTILN